MAQVISEDEFLRLQTQLIELKSTNYTLGERCRKQANELTSLNQRLESVDSEYQKALKTISKSKKAKEVEFIIQENEALQLKLQSQEDEFSLQNSTLMQELTAILNTNEDLEKEIKTLKLKEIPKKDPEVNLELNNEFRRLQAENEALKQSVKEAQLLNTLDLAQIKQKLRDLMSQKECLTNDIAAEGGQDDCNNVNEVVPVETDGYELVEVNDHEVSYKKSLCNSAVTELLNHIQVIIGNLETNLPQLSNLQLLVETERSDNELLRKELHQLKLAFDAKSDFSGDDTHSKLAEKLQKKQESFQQLQKEKEDMYNEFHKTIDNLKSSKDQEINQLKELNMRLQTQLNNTIQNFQEYKKQNSRIVQELESKVVNLQGEIDVQAAEKLHELEAERIVLISKLNDTKLSTDLMQKENINMAEKLKSCIQEKETLAEQLKELEQEKLSSQASLDTITKTSERRKHLIDEMSAKMQMKSDEYQHDVAHLTEKYSHQINVLVRKLEDEQARSKDLETLKTRLDDLESENKSLECARDFLKRHLSEAEEALDSTRRHYDELLSSTRSDFEKKIIQMEKDHKQIETELNIKLEISDTILRTEYEEQVLKLQQDVKDAAEDQKIQERKRMAVIKDLKRQLQSEKKRSEAVQEKLQQFLTENSQNELFKEVAEADKAETGSISSWSMMSGGGHSESKESRDDSSRFANGSTPSPPNVYEQDNEMLVKAVAQVQQEKAELEEKLKHLELCNAAMAEDIINKSTVIQHYCMEGRAEPHGKAIADKLTVKRVVDFIRDKGDENLKDMNRRMQRMVEETLFRNVNLQKDLDAMSQEVEKLRSDILTSTTVTLTSERVA